MAPPSADDVRLSPPVSRCHQLPFVCVVASFISLRCCRSGARDSGFAEVRNLTPEEIVARLLYRDGLMLVIDKPAGLRRASRPQGRREPGRPFDALRFGLPRPPVLAHRLDKDTSGCLVLGRHRKAPAPLGSCSSMAIDKTYWAIVEGAPPADEGTIEMPLGRLNAERGWWQKHDPDKGQPAVTNWKVMGRGSPPPVGRASAVGVGRLHAPVDALAHLPTPHPALPRKGGGKLTWLALEPVTGRTHQLRVHCAAMGWPIFGDNIYGNGPRFGGPMLHLHSREIVVPIYKNSTAVRVGAPVPPHMRAA